MWYTPEYPEEVFFEHWSFMAERYLDNPIVIGADLRNEVRYIKGKYLVKPATLSKFKSKFKPRNTFQVNKKVNIDNQ